jgi:hypothetical protein
MRLFLFAMLYPILSFTETISSDTVIDIYDGSVSNLIATDSSVINVHSGASLSTAKLSGRASLNVSANGGVGRLDVFQSAATDLKDETSEIKNHIVLIVNGTRFPRHS